jgi:chromosome segregation ATPase
MQRFKPMRRGAAAVAILAVLGACGDAEALDPAVERRIEQALERAEDAEKSVAGLERRIENLSARLTAAEDARDELAAVLDAKTSRLRRAIRDARAAIDGARGSADSAAHEASSALAEARKAARDLSVLGQRYDYHLKRYHGGG